MADCLSPPDLFGAEVMSKSEDEMTIKYGCRADFKLRGGNARATCSSHTGVWELSTLICDRKYCHNHLILH